LAGELAAQDFLLFLAARENLVDLIGVTLLL
jgi:hypothetical protein